MVTHSTIHHGSNLREAPRAPYPLRAKAQVLRGLCDLASSWPLALPSLPIAFTLALPPAWNRLPLIPTGLTPYALHVLRETLPNHRIHPLTPSKFIIALQISPLPE